MPPSMKLPALLLVLALGPGDESVDITREAPVERAEYFVLRHADQSGAQAPLGLVAWKRVQRGTGAVLERELLFGAGEQRVLHTENLALEAPRLVWRELGRRGRTWIAERKAGLGRIDTLEFGPAEEIHGQLPGAGARFPMELVEELRQVRQPDRQELLRVSPTQAGQERSCLVRLRRPPEEAPLVQDRTGLRAFELRAEDGTSLACWVFRGPALVAFRWGAGSPWATPVAESEWLELAAEWRAARREKAQDHASNTQGLRDKAKTGRELGS